MKRVGIVVVSVIGGLGVLLAGVWGALYLREPQTAGTGPAPTRQQATLKPAESSNMDLALKLIHEARARFASVKDYRCTYLRDEFIAGELKKNQLHLRVRHEPFSVYMEWHGPTDKQGQRAAYIAGQNNDRMRVRVKRLGLFISTSIAVDDPQARAESRHQITEAGLKNLIERFCTRWAKEKELGLTEVLIQEGEVKVAVGDKESRHPCICVITIHNPKDKEHFTFYRTKLYFDKATGLPIQMEGYDWPRDAHDRDGRLLEHYTYLNLEPNVGLTDADFTW
jgi:hypothetical protein